MKIPVSKSPYPRYSKLLSIAVPTIALQFESVIINIEQNNNISNFFILICNWSFILTPLTPIHGMTNSDLKFL